MGVVMSDGFDNERRHLRSVLKYMIRSSSKPLTMERINSILLKITKSDNEIVKYQKEIEQALLILEGQKAIILMDGKEYTHPEYIKNLPRYRSLDDEWIS